MKESWIELNLIIKPYKNVFSVKKRFAEQEFFFYVEWNFILIPLGTQSNIGV